MKKIKRMLKNIIHFFTSMRISTIYKLIGIVLLIGILLWVYKTINKSEKVENKQNIVLTGTITNKGEDYIIIKDASQNEYLINGINNKNYTIGSEINASVSAVMEQGNRIKPTTIKTNEIFVTKENTKNKNADEELLAYIKETENDFQDINTQEEAKIRFISIVDFLFYEGKINGYTLNDITNKTKLQILKITLSIDSKIENTFPGYKETISNSGKIYTGIKNKIIESYLTLATSICKFDANLCDTAKNDFGEIKEAFSITWNVIRNLIAGTSETLQDWYEIYSGKKE